MYHLDWVLAGLVLVLLHCLILAFLSRASWLLLLRRCCLQHAHYIYLHACTLYYTITICMILSPLNSSNSSSSSSTVCIISRLALGKVWSMFLTISYLGIHYQGLPQRRIRAGSQLGRSHLTFLAERGHPSPSCLERDQLLYPWTYLERK